jgi:cytochrome c
MKRITLTICSAACLLSCSNRSMPTASRSVQTNETGKSKPESDRLDEPVYKKGLYLVTQNDCFTCHKLTEEFVGPSFKEVANRYKSYPDSIVGHIASRVITGGSGAWRNVPMVPHKDLSNEDAVAMVRYILLRQ